MISWLKKESEIVNRQQDSSSTRFSVSAVGSDGRSKTAAECCVDLFLCATWFGLTCMIWSWIAAIESFEHQGMHGFVGLSNLPTWMEWYCNEWYLVDSLLNLADLPHRLSNRSLISAVLTDEVCSYDLHWRPHRFHKGQEQGFPNRCLVCWT